MIPLHTIISDIAKEATRILTRDSHIFVHPNIPRDKLAGAMSYVGNSVSPNEIVLVLDDTVFGSAKDGLALTDTTLYVREKFSEPVQYDFADISSITLRNEFFSQVLYVDDARVAAFSQPSKETLIALGLLLNTHLKQFQNKAESSNHSSQGQTAYGNAARGGTSDPLRTFEICMITADILTHFALFNGNQWRPEKLNVFDEMVIAFQNQPYLHALLQQRIHAIEAPSLDQSIGYFLRHEPPEEVKFELMWQAFQILALDESDLMDVESLIKSFAILLNVSPSIFNEFRQELRQRLGYGPQTSSNSHHHSHTTHSDITWACQILEIEQRSSTRDTVQHAYRNKIRDFHPDKHQSLPESVRQLVEGKTQELNQAREILLAHFTDTSTSL